MNLGDLFISAFVFCAYGLINLIVMMAVGYSGGQILPTYMQSVFILAPAYLLLWLCLIYVVLGQASVRTRNAARYGVFAPWALVLLITLPQFATSVGEASFYLVFSILVWCLHVPGEAIAQAINQKRTKRQSPPEST